MKSFLLVLLFVFVFSAAAFAQSDLPQSDKPGKSDKTGKPEDLEEKTNPPVLDKRTVKQAGDESVARVLNDEFSKLGYDQPARLSILGDVGRENHWNRNIIFKGHADPKNKAYNRGIISWQGQRRQKLDTFLKQEGVLGRGDDEELRGMARFMHNELQEEYPEVYMELATTLDTASASDALQKYIKYVPKAPYNSPDPDFKVKNNAKWANKARAMGLG